MHPAVPTTHAEGNWESLFYSPVVSFKANSCCTDIHRLMLTAIWLLYVPFSIFRCSMGENKSWTIYSNSDNTWPTKPNKLPFTVCLFVSVSTSLNAHELNKKKTKSIYRIKRLMLYCILSHLYRKLFYIWCSCTSNTRLY